MKSLFLEDSTMRYSILFLFAVYVPVSGLMAIRQSDQIKPNQEIFQEWLHSYEEDTKELKSYRPSSFDFPLGWGRTGMTFYENGNCMLLEIAPNDTLIHLVGEWKLITEEMIEVSFPSSDKETFFFEIVELSNEILIIKNDE